MTTPTPSARPEAQDVDLVEIAAQAIVLHHVTYRMGLLGKTPEEVKAGLKPDTLVRQAPPYRGEAEAVLAAVTPIIERRARWKALEDVEDIAVTHAFRDTDGAAVVPFGILNDYIDNELAALDQEESHAN